MRLTEDYGTPNVSRRGIVKVFGAFGTRLRMAFEVHFAYTTHIHNDVDFEVCFWQANNEGSILAEQVKG